jgi:hypothetical protein
LVINPGRRNDSEDRTPVWEDGVKIDLNEVELEVVGWTGFILSRMGHVAEGSNETPLDE